MKKIILCIIALFITFNAYAKVEFLSCGAEQDLYVIDRDQEYLYFLKVGQLKLITLSRDSGALINFGKKGNVGPHVVILI